MPSLPAPSAATEPQSRGTILHSQKVSLEMQWGEAGLRSVLERLTPEVREATTGPSFTPLGWYPTRYVVAWIEAIHDGPARRDEAALRKGVDLAIDLSFGRIRRVFLRFATPVLLAERAAALWRREHTHGSLTMDNDLAERRATVTLRCHPFTATFASRVVTAEIFRYVLSLSRAHNVRESHALHGDALRVTLLWD